MSQQSDSTDLLGGFKPVDVKLLVAPLRDEFERLFGATFSLEHNAKFLGHITVSPCTCVCNTEGSSHLGISPFRHALQGAVGMICCASCNTVNGLQWPAFLVSDLMS